MTTYAKLPVEIEAVQWTGRNISEILDFAPDNILRMHNYRDKKLFVLTREGGLWCEVGSYIIRGVEGEYYPCDPKIFSKTYRRVEPSQEENGAAT